MNRTMPALKNNGLRILQFMVLMRDLEIVEAFHERAIPMPAT